MPDARRLRLALAPSLLALALLARSSDAQDSAWVPLGPAPIPNGFTLGGVVNPVSGRATAIAVHPTNANVVYLGTANGGVWRTTNGGTTWTPLMDGAQSLAIGSLAIAPSSPDTVYVGTGEANFCLDCFFGVGLYRIDNASSATPNVVGPFALDALGANVLSGRSIGAIQVHPTDPATIFLATVRGRAGIGGTVSPLVPSRGVYRSTNATSASPTFAKLTGLLSGSDIDVRDIVLDPADANRLIVNAVPLSGLVGAAGIYLSTNALAPGPAFTQTASFATVDFNQILTKFAIHHDGSSPSATVYAATANGGGRLLRSLDGGASWTERIDNNFCGERCFYDIAVAVDPDHPDLVYLGGDLLAFGISDDGGSSYIPKVDGLHRATQAIAVAPSNPAIIYVANEGGIFRSSNLGASWVSLNNATLNTARIHSLAVHPTDPEFTLASATTFVGVVHRRSDGTWSRVDFGTGNVVIDQSAVNTMLTNMYHGLVGTSLIQGYAFHSDPAAAVDGGWALRGCVNFPGNGITCSIAALFIPALERGPGTPNTIYFANDRLYRSSDLGLNHSVVSQGPIVPGVAITAIGIAESSDAVRVVGLRGGQLYGTHTGATPLVDLDPAGQVPDQYVSDVEIDPNDPNTAYVALSAFGVASVWKTANLSSEGSAGWQAAAGGLPQAPVNALLIHPIHRAILWAATDAGVFFSTNRGQSWAPFGTGLPRVPVFDLALTIDGRLRIATLGRGVWETDTELPDGDADDVPDAVDNCPHTFNEIQTDTGGVHLGSAPDGIGDACQCGDVNDDGIVSPGDSSTFRAALANPSGAPLSPAGTAKCNVIGAAGPCRITDVAVTTRALETDPATGATLPPGIAPVCTAATAP